MCIIDGLVDMGAYEYSTESADIEISRPFVFFSDHVPINGSRTEDVYIYNTSAINLILGLLGASNPLEQPFKIVGDSCSNSILTSGNSCVLKISLSPSKKGLFNDRFDIESSDNNENPLFISVQGRGVVVSLDPTPSNATPSTGGGGGTISSLFIWSLFILVFLARRFREASDKGAKPILVDEGWYRIGRVALHVNSGRQTPEIRVREIRGRSPYRCVGFFPNVATVTRMDRGRVCFYC